MLQGYASYIGHTAKIVVQKWYNQFQVAVKSKLCATLPSLLLMGLIAMESCNLVNEEVWIRP